MAVVRHLAEISIFLDVKTWSPEVPIGGSKVWANTIRRSTAYLPAEILAL